MRKEGRGMSVMRYTADHEWLRVDDGDIATVGITDHAQSQLGDLVMIELPAVGKDVVKGAEVVVVESVKAASEVKAPVSGSIVEINEALASAPGKANEDPTGEGWFFKIKMSDPAELETLMDEAAYNRLVED
jgi:glycine cleavage system H protein